MAWKRLISVRNETKNFFSRQRPVQVRLRGVPVTADWAPAPWLRDHSESHFFGDTLYLARGSCLNRPERERPDVAVDRAVRGGVGARGRGGHRAEHLATQPVNTGAWPVGKVSRCQDKLWQDLASSRPPALSCPRCSWWRTGLPPSPSCKRLPPWERACVRARTSDVVSKCFVAHFDNWLAASCQTCLAHCEALRLVVHLLIVVLNWELWTYSYIAKFSKVFSYIVLRPYLHTRCSWCHRSHVHCECTPAPQQFGVMWWKTRWWPPIIPSTLGWRGGGPPRSCSWSSCFGKLWLFPIFNLWCEEVI